jgi:hypothetical protein
VIAKARNMAKRKSSTRTEGSSDATKRNRVDKEHSEARLHEQPGDDEIADDDILHDADAAMDDSEHVEGNPGGEYLNVVPLRTFDSKTGLDVTHTIILLVDGFPDVLHAEHGSPIETVEVDAEAAHGKLLLPLLCIYVYKLWSLFLILSFIHVCRYC